MNAALKVRHTDETMEAIRAYVMNEHRTSTWPSWGGWIRDAITDELSDAEFELLMNALMDGDDVYVGRMLRRALNDMYGEKAK